MLQLYPVYLFCSRRKTLTGSLDPTHANGMNKPCRIDMCKKITKDFQNRKTILQTFYNGGKHVRSCLHVITGHGRQAESGEILPIGGLVRICRDLCKSSRRKQSTVDDSN